MSDKQKNVTRNLKNHGAFFINKKNFKKLKKLLTFFIFYIKISLLKKEKNFFNGTYKNFFKKSFKKLLTKRKLYVKM